MEETDITFIDFAEYMADEAGEKIRALFRQNFAMEEKFDSSPVTEADKQAEEVMRKLIQNNFPDHGVFGEEFENKNLDAEYVWYLDPIDGTKSFIAGRPIFGTLIALAKNGQPVLGVIDQPINRERWVGALGANGKTKFRSKDGFHDAQTSGCKNLGDAVFATTSPFLFDAADISKVETVGESAKFSIYGGDCYNYAQIASGAVDLVIESGLKPFDYMALVNVVESAGGAVADWQGNQLSANSSGKIVAAASRELLDQTLGMLA